MASNEQIREALLRIWEVKRLHEARKAPVAAGKLGPAIEAWHGDVDALLVLVDHLAEFAAGAAHLIQCTCSGVPTQELPRACVRCELEIVLHLLKPEAGADIVINPVGCSVGRLRQLIDRVVPEHAPSRIFPHLAPNAPLSPGMLDLGGFASGAPVTKEQIAEHEALAESLAVPRGTVIMRQSVQRLYRGYLVDPVAGPKRAAFALADDQAHATKVMEQACGPVCTVVEVSEEESQTTMVLRAGAITFRLLWIWHYRASQGLRDAVILVAKPAENVPEYQLIEESTAPKQTAGGAKP